MQDVKKISLIVFLGASLIACSSHLEVYHNSQRLAINPSVSNSNQIDEIIQPFKDSIDKEMNQVIGYSQENLVVNRPSSSLMNWCADAIFTNQTKNIRLAQPTFCLLNTGGIRSSIGIGAISIGDIYKLMPFDNTIVWVELPIASLTDIENYILLSGGEPISNAKLENGKLIVNGMNEKSTHFWVITSDYLMNGGDKMGFFEKKTNLISNGKLLRLAFIEEVKSQGTLNFNEEVRITINK